LLLEIHYRAASTFYHILITFPSPLLSASTAVHLRRLSPINKIDPVHCWLASVTQQDIYLLSRISSTHPSLLKLLPTSFLLYPSTMTLVPITNRAQTQSITNALKNICREYPAGGGILRELLQNADDAGASVVVRSLDIHL
jgi:hypothetical protein